MEDDFDKNNKKNEKEEKKNAKDEEEDMYKDLATTGNRPPRECRAPQRKKSKSLTDDGIIAPIPFNLETSEEHKRKIRELLNLIDEKASSDPK